MEHSNTGLDTDYRGNKCSFEALKPYMYQTTKSGPNEITRAATDNDLIFL